MTETPRAQAQFERWVARMQQQRRTYREAMQRMRARRRTGVTTMPQKNSATTRQLAKLGVTDTSTHENTDSTHAARLKRLQRWEQIPDTLTPAQRDAVEEWRASGEVPVRLPGESATDKAVTRLTRGERG